LGGHAVTDLNASKKMGLFQTKCETEYPESDGEPMGESDWHIDWTIRLRQLLKWRYRDQSVYVGSDLIIYYEEGGPLKSIVPDGFVVLEHPTHRRRIFKTWEENRVPDVAFEFTSRSSRKKDSVAKPLIYSELGVKEYFVYDPEREYLQPPLQGFRLVGKGYARIEPDENQRLHCQVLGLTLCLHDDDLSIADLATGNPLLTQAEAEAQRAEAEAERAEAESERAKREAVSKQEIEAENERLRAEISQLRDQMRQ
jgi:Uma2 family endonuclease